MVATPLKGKEKQNYFLAVQAGVGRDYQPMKEIFRKIIEKTLKRYVLEP